MLPWCWLSDFLFVGDVGRPDLETAAGVRARESPSARQLRDVGRTAAACLTSSSVARARSGAPWQGSQRDSDSVPGYERRFNHALRLANRTGRAHRRHPVRPRPSSLFRAHEKGGRDGISITGVLPALENWRRATRLFSRRNAREHSWTHVWTAPF
jgi:hypothetical protein